MRDTKKIVVNIYKHIKCPAFFVCKFWTQSEYDQGEWAMFKVRPVNLYGKGVGEIVQSFSSPFSFFLRVATVGYEGVEDPRPRPAQ